MKKGLGVIVAEPDKNGTLWTDTIINCDADMMSIGSPVILQTANFAKISADKTLYVCGHGDKSKRTISKLTMRELAGLFKEHGYTGKQQIVLASCYAKCKKHGKTLSDELRNELHALGIECRCDAISKEISIICPEGGEFNCASIKMKAIHKGSFFKIQNMLFGSVHTDKLTSDSKINMNTVQNWNRDAINGKLFGVNAALAEFTIIVTACIASIILRYLSISVSIFLPMWVVWILAELFTLSGTGWSVFLWIPVFLGIPPKLIVLLALRIVISFALGTFTLFRCFRKYKFA